MAGADVVLKTRYESDASQGVPIEPRAVLAEWRGDEVTIWSSTQVPYAARSGVAQTLQIPEANVRVVVPLLGGGFGAKCDFHFEAQVAALARAARRPVRLVFSREEEFRAIAQRREGIVMEIETGATKDGHLVAREGAPDPGQGCVLRRGRVPGADGRDACVRSVSDRPHRRGVIPQLHEPPAIRLRPGADRPPGVLGARAAHGRAGAASSASTRSSSDGGR